MSKKFRPAFTESQLTRISDLVSQSERQDDLEIKRIIVPLLSKISVGAISPAYTISPEYSDKLQANQMRQRYENGEMTQEEEQIYEATILGV